MLVIVVVSEVVRRGDGVPDVRDGGCSGGRGGDGGGKDGGGDPGRGHGCGPPQICNFCDMNGHTKSTIGTSGVNMSTHTKCMIKYALHQF